MHIENKNREPKSYTLKPDISGMELTTSRKGIGMIINNKLSFDTHIAEKSTQATSVVGAIRRSFDIWIKTRSIMSADKDICLVRGIVITTSIVNCTPSVQ